MRYILVWALSMCTLLATSSLTCTGVEVIIDTSFVTVPAARKRTMYEDPCFAVKVSPVVV